MLDQAPRAFGVAQTRWRLADLGHQVSWLQSATVAAIWRQVQRLGLRHKLSESFLVSPDPAYDAKWRRVLAAYAAALDTPQQVVLLFGDELTYYKKPTLRAQWQVGGRRVHRVVMPNRGGNTRTRLTAAINALTGQVHPRQRSTIGRKELCAWLTELRQHYATATQLYLVWDNWPTHRHPEVLRTVAKLGITLLFLPTYASWLNPIERFWRWLRQDVLHNFEPTQDLEAKRTQVLTWLEAYSVPSPTVLYRIGLLTKPELDQLCRLNC